MQITNQIISKQMINSQNHVSAGDVGPVLIKNRLSGNEANVLFKGQEFSAKFEGFVPSADRMLAEVVGMPEKGKLVLTEASSAGTASSTTNQSMDSRLVKAGIDPANNTDLKNAIKIFDGKGISLNNEDFVTLQKFMTESAGTASEKLETVNVLAQKNLQVTSTHLNSIHTALHGTDLKDALREIAGEIKFDALRSPNNPASGGVPAETAPKSLEQILQQIKSGEYSLKDIEELVRRLDTKGNPEIDKLKQEIAKALQIHAAGTERIKQSSNYQAIADGEKLHKIAAAQLRDSLERLAAQLSNRMENRSPDESVSKLHSLLKDAQKEASLTKMLESIGKAIQDFSPNKTQLTSSFETAAKLADQGRELAARKVVAEALNQLEKDYPPLQKGGEQQLSLNDAEQYALNESLQSLSLQSKSILVTEITKKLSQLAIDFKKVKQEITKSLDHVSLVLDKGGSKVNAKQTLDAAINKLDNAILKGDFMLYTDMQTEKKMLTASSRLAEARNLLAKGDFSQASQIVKEIKTTLDQIIYKPSNKRVQHFVSEQSLLTTSKTMEEQLANGIKQVVKPMPDQDYSARQVFESLKRLGLSHEHDASNSLVFGSKGEQDDLNQNLKARLIQMVQDTDGHPKAEQALANITGQQLLNKQDPSGMQNLLLQMPFLLNQEMENIKVFINSQKSGDKIDWENCNLYFVLESKKLGEVGINVTAQNRNISITFNSKTDGLDTLLKPMTEISKERLQEIGYKLEALKAKKPELEKETADNQPSKLTPAFTEKGYNFTI